MLVQILPYEIIGESVRSTRSPLSYYPSIIKAWCDVTTDGGGFVLVAKKDDPVTWTVPSSKETVDPHGKPHWSSTFGKVEMLDIRFQISTTSNFKDTKAHW